MLELNEIYEHKEVIILFLYVDDFPDMIIQHGKNIFKILDDFYKSIDDLTQKFGIEKLEVL